MTKLFTPSSTDLRNMVKAAEAKFAADRERAQVIFSHNHRRLREKLGVA